VIRRPAYTPFETKITLSEGEAPKIIPRWTPKAAIILMWPTDERKDSELKLDGQTHSVSVEQPLQIAVEPGEHTIQITRPEARPFVASVSLADGKRQTIQVRTPERATLVIHWPLEERQGAVMTIDGERLRPLAEVDCDLSIPLGQHTIKIARPGFQSFVQAVTIEKGGHRPLIPTWVIDHPTPGAADPAANKVAIVGGESRQSVAKASAARDQDAAAAPQKHRIPSASEQEQIAKDLAELSGPATSFDGQLARVKELYGLADRSENFSEKYVLLIKGATLAAAAPDLDLALQAVDSLSSEFEIDALKLKLQLTEPIRSRSSLLRRCRSTTRQYLPTDST
jgi:hypothetical protein